MGGLSLHTDWRGLPEPYVMDAAVTQRSRRTNIGRCLSIVCLLVGLGAVTFLLNQREVERDVAMVTLEIPGDPAQRLPSDAFEKLRDTAWLCR